jgi:SAM-dependent methyltransferase
MADDIKATENSNSEASKPLLEEIRSYWDEDAPTYDNTTGHHPRNPAVLAAWAAALASVLPPAPAKVLDVGAGTGFLSLIAARLGHHVTALDLAPQMLEKLKSAAAREGLEVEILVGPADKPPEGFDAVMERHLLWTLPDPEDALAAWRKAASRLILVESLWGKNNPVEFARGRIHHFLKELRGTPHDHHASYSEEMLDSLPLGEGTTPTGLIDMASKQGWRGIRLERLLDVEWAEREDLPLIDRLVGVSPRFIVVAD